MNPSPAYITASANKPLHRISIPESARESLMSMMKEIMEKSQLSDGELHYIPEESIQESILAEKEDAMHNRINECSSQSDGSRKVKQKTRNSPIVPSQQCFKLMEITQRCGNYYNCFFSEKQSQLHIIQKTFNDLNTNLNTAFEEIINELVKKQKQLKQFLLKKYEEIVGFRTHQDNRLKSALRNIQALPHLTNNSQEISYELHNYASTLNQFYIIMEDIEKSSFKQMVEQSVNFINNLVAEEIRVTLYEKIPTRLTEKHMMRESSKDFLTESREGSLQPRTDTFAILDIDSFTKLFFDIDDKLDSGRGMAKNDQKPPQTHKSDDEIPKSNGALFGKNNKQLNQSKSFLNVMKSDGNLMEYNEQTKTTKTPSKQSSNTMSQCRSRQHQKISYKKETSISPSLSPNKLKLSTENGQTQSQIQLIRKISYQQSNRSAKIKGYMVTFQDPKLLNIDGSSIVNQGKNLQNRNPKGSKSPSQVNKTPTKVNKSTEKKPLISSVSMNVSNQQKLKNSSLKSSRASVISEFKVTPSRRQSIVNNK